MVGWTTAFVVAGVGLAAWPALVWNEVRKLEKPSYKLLRVLGTDRLWSGENVCEVRQYAPVILAEVEVSEGTDPSMSERDGPPGSMRHAMRTGVRAAAGYIFGKNVQSEKVAMTSPVRAEVPQARSEGEKIAMTSPVRTEVVGQAYRVSFVMPSKYTLDTLPTPQNPNVKLREEGGGVYAALAWKGNLPQEEGLRAKERQLRDRLKAEGLDPDPDSPLLLHQYYPPSAPGWIRLNEVLLRLAEIHDKREQ